MVWLTSGCAKPKALPERVLFGQRRIGFRFSLAGKFRGRTITSVARDLKKGKLTADDLPIEAFRGRNGELITVNNRSLAALSLAGLRPTKITIVQPTRAQTPAQRAAGSTKCADART
jgi:hypothetical protein